MLLFRGVKQKENLKASVLNREQILQLTHTETGSAGTFSFRLMMPHLDKKKKKNTANLVLCGSESKPGERSETDGRSKVFYIITPHQDNVNICTTDGGKAEVMSLEEVVMTTASSKAMPSC